MVVFDNHAFQLSDDMVINTIDTKEALITIIDNFYRDFDYVCEQVEKLPITYAEYNNEDLLDSRKCYIGNMRGTRLPYTKEYCHYIKDIVQYGGNVDCDDILLVNYNIALTDKYMDYYYNIHTDDSCSDLATIVFLNKSYQSSEGLNTYIPNTCPIDELWIPKDVPELNYHVEAKPNRAVVISTQLPHSACFETDQFTKEPRLTQVIFHRLN